MNNYDLTGYVSPIQRIAREVQARIEEHEGQILLKAVHDVGFDVDKHELMKALAYDREQYKKGYADAMKNAVPLDKLCDWLERNAAGRWNGLEYTAAGWKDELTKWMEGLDAVD